MPCEARATSSSIAADVLRAHEERNAVRLTIARTGVFVLIFFWLWWSYGSEVAFGELPVMALFVANGLWSYAWYRWRPDDAWISYLVIAIDGLLLSLTQFWPGNVYPDSWPWSMVLRQPVFAYYFIIVALAALSFRPGLILWAGIVSLISWIVAYLLILTTPGYQPLTGDPGELAALALVLQPDYVQLEGLFVRGFVVTLVAAILALGARRVRDLMTEQAEVARERGNLARYLSPTLVGQLARTDSPLGPPRQVEAAVLFADIVGFTAMAERLRPEDTMNLLRHFHREMAEAVFEHGGTVDKFIGDGLMATFGAVGGRMAPEVSAHRAAACAIAMRERLRQWSDERERYGEPPVRMGIGIHAGTVTIGDIGHHQRLEFAVVGDCVNLASRLEGLTRDLGADILASDALRQLAGDDVGVGWQDQGAHKPRGREGSLRIWSLPG